MKKANVAIVGCGNISSIYLENLTGRFKNLLPGSWRILQGQGMWHHR